MEEKDPKTIYPYPVGKAHSRVWTYFGFYKAQEGPLTKENLDMTKVVCKLCRKEYANKVIPILLKLAKCVETNVNDPPPIARLKDVMRQELNSRTQDKDLSLFGCLLNPTMKDLEFLRDSERAGGHALLLKVAFGMADVKVNVKVEPGTNDK
ncbi:hypothetical protein CHS0354_021243 [Potamilus streckersoni]|uniref:BED-type domain-containing protein n=1 Tax=Potamilus streckersoni TaxID=2493646 RepID=A0AAE0S479_9BIVA|nr:hypothetical protein CHS0354_021243 [Potamilus streckersoni]